jgi:putative pyruvate formate lyase activating enzyme
MERDSATTRTAGDPKTLTDRDESRFILEPFEPAYRALSDKELTARVQRGLAELEACRACPRNCQVDRMQNETRVCKTGRFARVASAFAHQGEEACLRGWNGSGTIFFSLCNLQCVFCQNWDISQQASGVECPPDKIAEIMLALQRKGCHNLNFVTPEHVVPQVLEAIAAAIPSGLNVPLVYNTSAYDSLESLRLLDGIVDIYMPDFKFWKRETAKRLAAAPDYPERAREAILEMQRQVGVLKVSPQGIARRGILLRHLVMPGHVDETEAIFRWLAQEVSADTHVNIMGQYHPDYRVTQRHEHTASPYEEINRCPTRDEMQAAYQAARHAGLWRLDK